MEEAEKSDTVDRSVDTAPGSLRPVQPNVARSQIARLFEPDSPAAEVDPDNSVDSWLRLGFAADRAVAVAHHREQTAMVDRAAGKQVEASVAEAAHRIWP